MMKYILTLFLAFTFFVVKSQVKLLTLSELESRVAKGNDTTYVINFWATWCPPCVEELPMLNAFYQTQRAKGWTVLGLAVDKEAAVSTFLQRMPLTFPIAIAGMQGAALSKELGNSAGGLPFTVLFDRHGAVQHRKMGQLHASDLQNWASL